MLRQEARSNLRAPGTAQADPPAGSNGGSIFLVFGNKGLQQADVSGTALCLERLAQIGADDFRLEFGDLCVFVEGEEARLRRRSPGGSAGVGWGRRLAVSAAPGLDGDIANSRGLCNKSTSPSRRRRSRLDVKQIK